MIARKLIVTAEAQSDLMNRARYLNQQRGIDFALRWLAEIEKWLEKTVAHGAVIGTKHPRQATLRSFPYKKQATAIAEFTPTELRVVRVYFPGQDWSR